MKSKYSKNIICLLLADLIWGAAFVAQRTGGDLVGAYTFSCLRSFIAIVALLPVLALRKKRGEDGKADRKLLLGGLCCGTALALATNFQQLGITLGASVGKAGFLTACYILLVPIFGLFLGKRCGWNLAVGVALAMGGLYFLCAAGTDFHLTKPDLLLLLCAVMFAIQILSIDHFAPMVDTVKLSWLEFLVCGIISLVPMWYVDMGHSYRGFCDWCLAFSSPGAWIALLYTGVCSSAIAYTLQIAGQKNFHPAMASLLMSLESVFSVFFGWLLLGERMTGRELLGCGLIFGAVILAQIPVGRSKN